jgi:hypothetical protein
VPVETKVNRPRFIYVTDHKKYRTMKKSLSILSALFFFVFAISACSERGPAGPEGPQGPPGPETLPVSFEFEAWITEENDFEFYQVIPEEIDIFDSDVVLMFVLEHTEDDLDVWRKLPLTEFNSKGTVLFDYDFTVIDVRLFLDANYSLAEEDGYEGVFMRGVHVPANFMSKAVHSQSIHDVETFEELELFLGQEIKQLGKQN